MLGLFLVNLEGQGLSRLAEVACARVVAEVSVVVAPVDALACAHPAACPSVGHIPIQKQLLRVAVHFFLEALLQGRRFFLEGCAPVFKDIYI